jgi:hypothetical protein
VSDAAQEPADADDPTRELADTPMVPVEPDDAGRWAPVAGRHALGLSTGWAIFEADVELTDLDGALGGGSGQDDSKLDPVWGGAAKYNYFFTENFALGAIAELRTFDASLIRPLASDISPDEYTSLHLLLSGRVYSDPLSFARRFKLFGGVDLGYVPGIDLEAEVLYSPQYRQTIALEGDDFFTLSVVAGTSMWVGDWLGTDASFELGAFYETALDSTDDELTLLIPNGLGGLTPNDVAGEVVPQGVIFFAGLTFYL